VVGKGITIGAEVSTPVHGERYDVLARRTSAASGKPHDDGGGVAPMAPATSRVRRING
jgi:hypothetical protein